MKNLLIGLVLLGSAASTFAFDLKDLNPSVGVGAGFTAESRGFSVSGKMSGYDGSTDSTLTTNALALDAFVDFTYGETSVGLRSQLGKMHSTANGKGWGSHSSDGDTDSQFLVLNLKALAKYPVAVGTLSIFPLVGLEYGMVLSSQNITSPVSPSDFNALFLDLGAGLDYPVGDRFYVRGEALFGLNLTPDIQGFKDHYAKYNLTPTSRGYRLGGSVSVGYKL